MRARPSRSHQPAVCPPGTAPPLAPGGRVGTTARLAFTGALAVALLGGALAPAAAQGGGPERMAFEESFDSGPEAPDPFWVEQCGVEVRQTATLSVRGTVHGDGRSVLHIVETSEWTDFGTGEVLLRQRDREVLTDTVLSDTVDEQAGTRTVVLDVAYRGLPLRLHAPGEGVVVVDAGRLDRTITRVLDVQSGDVISEDVQLDRVAGRWSFLGLLADGAGPGFEELVAVVCDRLD